MKEKLGFRIFTDIDRPSQELIQKFEGLPSSNINDTMNRLFCMRHEIEPLNDKPLLGPAFTIHTAMGDNLMLHQALDLAKEGDILVIDGEGCEDRSLMGEMLLSYAEGRGIAGVIVDGAFRDRRAAKRANIPVYCRSITPQGPFKNGPGEVNVPISCGGQVVFPGDILAGDEDGIVVIHKEYAEEVLEDSIKKHNSEIIKSQNHQKGVASGELFSKHTAKYSKIFDDLGGQRISSTYSKNFFEK